MTPATHQTRAKMLALTTLCTSIFTRPSVLQPKAERRDPVQIGRRSGGFALTLPALARIEVRP